MGQLLNPPAKEDYLFLEFSLERILTPACDRARVILVLTPPIQCFLPMFSGQKADAEVNYLRVPGADV